jgi:alcohol dehydrogenase (cytochrome c)
MKTLRLLVLLLALPTIWLSAQSPSAGGLDPAAIKKPLSDAWTVYSGDYSGRRFSALKQVDRTTVKNLALAWVARLTAGTGAGTPAPVAHRAVAARPPAGHR